MPSGGADRGEGRKPVSGNQPAAGRGWRRRARSRPRRECRSAEAWITHRGVIAFEDIVGIEGRGQFHPSETPKLKIAKRYS